MAEFFAELKRRNIYRVSAAYAVVAWVLVQLVANLVPLLGLPAWVARAILLLLIVGFPIVVVFAWVHEIAPGSVRRGSGWGDAPVKHNKADWILTGALVVVIALVSYQQLVPTRTSRETSGAPTSAPGTVSIAVLPFVNLSSDAEQKFFSDGMTEEISSALAKLQGLTVLARSSSFAPEIQNLPAREKSRALNARYLIEGSVRQAGNRVRISAQLVGGADGVQIWTENYDRELTDIFAIQEEIAQAIAGALRVPLGLGQGERLVSNRIDDVDTYQQYLRAKALVRARGLARLTEAAMLLEQVVDRDRGFAPAWALLAQAYALTPIFHPASRGNSVEEFRPIVDGSLPKAEAAARRSIELDPAHADGYLSLGLVQDERGKFVLAEELYAKALALDPNNPDGLFRQGLLFSELGRVKEGLDALEKLRTLEPFVPIYNSGRARLLAINGRDGEAIALLKALPADEVGRGAAAILASIYAAAGRYPESVDALLMRSAADQLPGVLDAATRLLRTAPTTTSSPQSLPPVGDLGFVYIHVGAPSRVLDNYEVNVDAGYLNAVQALELWYPAYAPVRQTQRFKAFARKAGLVDYWRAKGWPEFCRPTTGDDFVCN